jgi:prepilin-type N-terminal cleavage/methylation domain-containing protein
VKRAGREGYTLMEVMMVVAILGIVSSVAAGILLQANRYFIFTRTKGNLQRESRAAMYVITRELRQAQSNSIVIDRVSAKQPFYSRITYTKIGAATTTSFEQIGPKLLMVAGTCNVSACQKVLADDLLYFAVTFPQTDDMTIVSVSMTLQENIYQGQTRALHMASEKVQVMN